MSKDVNKRVEIHLTDATVLQTVSQVGYDMRGRIVTRSNDSIIGKCYKNNEDTGDVVQRLNFEDLDFITLSKADARNLTVVIDRLLERIHEMTMDTTGSDNITDEELLGYEGISYERLFDYLNLVTFHKPETDEVPKRMKAKEVKENDD